MEWTRKSPHSWTFPIIHRWNWFPALFQVLKATPALRHYLLLCPLSGKHCLLSHRASSNAFFKLMLNIDTPGNCSSMTQWKRVRPTLILPLAVYILPFFSVWYICILFIYWVLPLEWKLYKGRVLKHFFLHCCFLISQYETWHILLLDA